MAAVDVVLLIVFALLFFKDTSNLIQYRFEESDFQAYTRDMGERCFGGTIYETFEAGLYDSLPDFFLRKGFYEYTVTWDGASDGSFLWPHVYIDGRYDTIEQAVSYMNEGLETSHHDNFWLNVDSAGISLRLYYSGTGAATIKSFEIWETPVQARFDFLSRLLVLLVLNICLLLYQRNKRQPIENGTRMVALSIIGMTFLACLPLLGPGAIEGHDFRFHLVRIEGIKDAWLSGQFPVRLNPDFYKGYGYANPIFYGEIFLYFPAFLRLIGVRLTTAYDCFVVAVNLATALVTYYSAKYIFKNRGIAGMVAFLYTLAPYRIIDIYQRSAVGEYTAMIFLPLVVVGMYKIYTDDTTKKAYRFCYLPLAIALTGIIQSHVLTGEMTGIFILAVCVLALIRTFQKPRFFALVKTVIVTLLINAWFLLPFLDFSQTQEIRVLRAKKWEYLQDGGLFWDQIIGLFPRYSYYPRSAGDVLRNEMPLCLGLGLVLGVLLCGAMLILKRKEETGTQRKMAWICLGLCILACFMTTVDFPWDRIMERIPNLAHVVYSIQFIWRFLAIASVFAVILCGFGVLFLEKRFGSAIGYVAAAVICILTLIGSVYFMEDTIQNTRVWVYNDLDEVDTMAAVSGAEYSIMNASWPVINEVDQPEVNGAEITAYEKEGSVLSFEVLDSAEGGTVTLPILAYKGYAIKDSDGLLNQSNVSQSEDARVMIVLPERYTGTITVFYKGMWYWRVGEAVSVLTLLGIVVLKVRSKRKENVKV